MAETTSAPQRSPEYALHREVLAVDPAGGDSVKAHGMNMRDYKTALVQVVPTDGANPTVEVYFWSEAAGKFIAPHTTISKAGVGVNTPFEFEVAAYGRIMWIRVGTMAAGAAKIYVAGAEPDFLG